MENTSDDLQKQISKITEKRKQLEDDIKNLQKYRPKKGTKKSGQDYHQVTLENNKKIFVSEKDFQKHVKTWEREYAKFIQKDQEFYQKLNTLTAEASRRTPIAKKHQTNIIQEIQQKKQKHSSVINKIEDFTNNIQLIIGEWEKTAVMLDNKGVDAVNSGRDFIALSKSYFVLSKKYLKLVENADSIVSSIGNKQENYNAAVNGFDVLVKKDLEYQHQIKTLDDRFLIATKTKSDRENKKTTKQQDDIRKSQERADKQKKSYDDALAKENIRQQERFRKQELESQISGLENERMEMRREKKLAIEEIKNRKLSDKEKSKKKSSTAVLGGLIHAPFKAVGVDFTDEARLLGSVFKPVGKVLGKVFGKTQDSSKYALPEGLGVNDFAGIDSEIQNLRLKKKFEKIPQPQPRQMRTMGGAFNSTYNSNSYSSGNISNQTTSSNQSNVNQTTSSNQSAINPQPLDLNRTDDQNPVVEEIKKTNGLLEKILKRDSKQNKTGSGGILSGLGGALGGILGGLAGVGRLLGSLGGVLGSALRGIGALIPMLPAIAPFALGAAAIGTTVWSGKKIYDVIRDRRDLKQTKESSLNSMTETMTQKLMESGAPKEVIEKFADLSSKRSDLMGENDSPESAHQIKQIDSEMKTIQKAYLRHKEETNVEKINNNNNQNSSVIKQMNQKVDVSSSDQKTSRISETISNDKTVSEEFQDFLIGDFLNTLVKKLAEQLNNRGPGVSRMPGMYPF